eukprot:Gb_18242 [translate_table: standard]
MVIDLNVWDCCTFTLNPNFQNAEPKFAPAPAPTLVPAPAPMNPGNSDPGREKSASGESGDTFNIITEGKPWSSKKGSKLETRVRRAEAEIRTDGMELNLKLQGALAGHVKMTKADGNYEFCIVVAWKKIPAIAAALFNSLWLRFSVIYFGMS